MQMFANHQNQNYGSSSSYVELGHNINCETNGIVARPESDLNLTTEESIHVASFQLLDQNTQNRAIGLLQQLKLGKEGFRNSGSRNLLETRVNNIHFDVYLISFLVSSLLEIQI